MTSSVRPAGRHALPLARFARMHTTDPGRAELEAAKVMSPHRMQAGPGAGFRARIHHTRLGGLGLMGLDLAGPASVEVSEPVDYHILILVLTGGLAVDVDGRRALIRGGDGCVLGPADRMRFDLAPGTLQVVVRVPTTALQRTLGRLTGDADEALPAFDLDVRPGLGWTGTLRLVVDTLDRCATPCPDPVVGEDIERMLLTSVALSGIGADGRLRLRDARFRGHRAAIRPADTMRRDPAGSHPVAQLARDAGVSVRTLQAGFADRFGCGPGAYLRRLRLEAAHCRLRADPTRSVTEVALDSGFAHLGRFAAAYRAHFGVSPSETLARSRSADDAA